MSLEKFISSIIMFMQLLNLMIAIKHAYTFQDVIENIKI